MNEVMLLAFEDELEKIAMSKEAAGLGLLKSLRGALTPASSQMSKAVAKSQGKVGILSRAKRALTPQSAQMQKAVAKESKFLPKGAKPTTGSAPKPTAPAPAPPAATPKPAAPLAPGTAGTTTGPMYGPAAPAGSTIPEAWKPYMIGAGVGAGSLGAGQLALSQ
jgi:hypothetical protein